MTVKEAVKKSGTPVALSGASIDAADQLIKSGEKVLHAVAANCSVDNSRVNGALVVTSHRILFCSSTLGKVWSRHILLDGCVGLGDITGRIICKMKISSETMAIIVELNRDQLAALQAAILDAVANYSNQLPIDFSIPDPSAALSSTGNDIKSETIKICRECGDRLLAGARKCPSCGSKDLVEVDREDVERISQLRAAAHSKRQSRPTAAVTPVGPVTKHGQAKQRIKDNKAAGVACCPKCGSTSLSANKKGFSAGKAAAGIFLTGGLAGAVAGGIGANKVEVTCLNCGHKFRP